MHTGVIIAGGRSTRFGDEDKALADLAGRPMVRRVADRLAPAVDAVVVNCRADQADGIREAMEDYPREVRLALDEESDQGPMAGIRTGLRGAEELAASSEDGFAFVAACDMPFVDAEFVAHLFERADGHDAAVPRLDDEWFQTTHAVYHAKRMADACDRALTEGKRKIIEPLFELDYVVVEEDEVRERADMRTFDNVNTQEEFEAAAAELAEDENQ